MLAAGVSYYFARKGIDERRAKQDAEGTRPSEMLDCSHTFVNAHAANLNVFQGNSALSGMSTLSPLLRTPKTRQAVGMCMSKLAPRQMKRHRDIERTS